MKQLIPILFLALVLNTESQAQQHLISYELIHHYTKAEVQTILDNYSIPNSVLNPEFELDYYKVIYSTTNALGTDTTYASGAIVVPTGVTCPMPMISYQHGTTSQRTAIPSVRGGSEYQIGVIASATSGFICAMPDYLGLGESPGFHPYVNSRTEASASVDLLRTLRELKDSIGYNLNDQLFLLGYSQGGHATMALFKEIETNLSNEFTVTACAPMSGPYDVSGVQAATIIDDTAYATPGYLPYVIMGQQAAYGNVYNSLSEIFKSPYDTLLPGYFDGTHGMGWINNQLPDTPNVILDSAYFHSFLNNPNHPGWAYLKDNDLYNWAPQAPLEMYYCTGDEQVFYKNSLVARDSMRALGATHVNAVGFGNLNHTDCAPLCFLTGFSFFELYMNTAGGMTVGATTSDASSSSAGDGSVTIIPNNGTAPYAYAWQDGVSGLTTATITGLNPNTYNVRVSDSRGCYTSYEASIGVANSTHKIEASNYFKLMPNPAQDVVYLKVLTQFEGSMNIRFMDMAGRIVHETEETTLPFISYDVSQMPNGVYLVRVDQGGAIYTQRLVIQR